MFDKLRLLATAGATPKVLLIITGISLAVGGVAGWRAHKLVIDAENGRATKAAIEDFSGRTEGTRGVGMNLETGLNEYRGTVKPQGASHENDTGANDRYTPQRVRAIQDRFAAGKSAEQRIR